MTAQLTIGVDIGGSKVLAGVVDALGTVRDRLQLVTPHRSTSPQIVEDTIVTAVERLRAVRYDDGEVAAVGVGAAGFVDATGASVLFSPHLSWRDEPLRAKLTARLGVPVVLDNDANTAALAEVRFGAGRGHRQILCVTLGTGIGGALVMDGRVFRGANGMAGEFGHMTVVRGGRSCECGQSGCWEQYCSGHALVREARSRMAGDPSLLTGPAITAAARAGDAAARACFDEIGGWLGVGLAGLVAAFDPELIIVGGGVSDAGELLLAPAREALATGLTGRGFRPEPPVVVALLGAEAGLIGAAHAARTALLDQPDRIALDRRGP